MNDEERRAGRLDALMQSGLNHEDARFVDDLAVHACDQAMETFNRIIQTAPPHLSGGVSIVGLKMLDAMSTVALRAATLMVALRIPPAMAQQMAEDSMAAEDAALEEVECTNPNCPIHGDAAKAEQTTH